MGESSGEPSLPRVIRLPLKSAVRKNANGGASFQTCVTLRFRLEVKMCISTSRRFGMEFATRRRESILATFESQLEKDRVRRAISSILAISRWICSGVQPSS